MIQAFLRYALVGVANTALHWLVFGLLFHLTDDQGISNLLAFCLAVTFSFFINARFTFRARPTGPGYLLFVCFMGALSYFTGFLAQKNQLPPLVTLLAFTSISLGLGFLFSRYVVFAKKNT